MIDYSKIIQSKYLDFFNSEEAKKINRPNDVMDEFFNDMRDLAASMPTDVSVTEIIGQIFENNKMLFENKEDLIGWKKIEIIADSDNLNTLSEIELFILLWYCSCKNVLLYEEAYYVGMTRNGVIGMMLKALKKE